LKVLNAVYEKVRTSNYGSVEEENAAIAGKKIIWLGIKNLIQTFEDLDNVENVQADILAIRNLLDEDEKTNGEEHAC
jgi:hypothetical protein